MKIIDFIFLKIIEFFIYFIFLKNKVPASKKKKL